MRRRIIIDTDPGLDDAVAILLALAASEELEILGLVAVAGNLPLTQTERNARRVCELAGRLDVPVYAGSARPILRPLATAERVHRETDRDRLLLPDPTMALQPQHGVDFLVERLGASEAKAITFCALGPLTNIALALAKAPEVAGKIRELVVMGGACFELGNVTPAAEFNMNVDPHAAAIVFDSGIPITMIPLDVTHRLATTEPRLASLRALSNRCGAAVAALLARISREQGVSVLLVAHDVNPLLSYMDRVVYFGAGGAAVGPPSEVITGPTLSRLYGVPIEVLRTADGRLFVAGLPEAPAHHSDRHEHH